MDLAINEKQETKAFVNDSVERNLIIVIFNSIFIRIGHENYNDCGFRITRSFSMF